MNPFKYGQVVRDKDFCPRPDLVEQLDKFVESGQNVVLIGERRMGKTSLVCETLRRLKDCRMVYIDLLEVKTADDVCRRMIKAVFSAQRNTAFIERFLKSIAGLRPAVTIDPISGQPSLTLDQRTALTPKSMGSVIETFGEMNNDRRTAVVFDEFQDILNLKDSRAVLAELRSSIQFQGEIPYIFAGSVRNSITDIFYDPDSPFFKSAQSLEIGPLNDSRFASFLAKRFSEGRRIVSKETLLKITEMLEFVPGDVQEFCCALWDRTSPGDTVSEEHFAKALELVFSRESKTYEAILGHTTGQQLKCLTGLTTVGGRSPFSAVFLEASGISLPGSVRKAIEGLVKKKIIYHYQGTYKFANPFFKLWLQWKNY